VVAQCRLSKSYTHDEARIDTCFECCIYPDVPILKITTRICREEIFLSCFFCLSLDDEFPIIRSEIYSCTDSSDDIRDEFVLIARWEIRVVENRCIEYSKWIYSFAIFPYFEMEMCSCRHRSCSASSWSTSGSRYDISLPDELVWKYENLGEMSVDTHVSIWMLKCHIGVSS
jgi:hypothetical protein